MKKSLLIVLICLAFAACTKEKTADNKNKVINYKFRIQNNTSAAFDSVFVKMGASENHYGVIQPDQYSDYKSFSEIHSPLIRISSGGQTTTITIALTDNNGSDGFSSSPSKQPSGSTCVIEIYNNQYSVHFLSEYDPL